MKRNMNKWIATGEAIMKDSNRDITILEIRQIVEQITSDESGIKGYTDIVMDAFRLGVAVGYKECESKKK